MVGGQWASAGEEVHALEHVVHEGGAFLQQVRGPGRPFRRNIDALFSELPTQRLAQLGIRTLAQVLLVEPAGLLRIEPGPALVHPVQREGVDQFVQAEQFLFGARVPAQQGQHVHEGLRIIPALPVAAAAFTRGRVGPVQREDREPEAIAIALAQFPVAVGLQNQRQVGELRPFPAEGLVQQHVQGGTGQPLLAPHHVRDRHQVVVHDVGQVVGGHAVALEQHLVIDVAALHHHPSPDAVLEANLLMAGHFQPHHIGFSVRQPGLHLVRRQAQAVAHVFTGHRVVSGCGHSCCLQPFAHGIQFLGGVEGVVRLVRLDQLVHVAAVQVLAFALPVGPVRPALPGTLVGAEATPVQRLADVLLGPGHVPCLVRVLDPQDEGAPRLTGQQMVVQGGAHPAHVQRAGGAGCETDADAHVRVF